MNALRNSTELRATVEFCIERPLLDRARLRSERQEEIGLEAGFKSKVNFFENQANFIDGKKRLAPNGKVRRLSCYEVLREGEFISGHAPIQGLGISFLFTCSLRD